MLKFENHTIGVTNLDSELKSRDITLWIKVHIIKAMVYPVVTYRCELDLKEGWALKNWCFQTVVLEKTLESPLGSKEIKLVNSKGNQSWTFIGRTDAEAEVPVLWPTGGKIGLIGKRPWSWERLRAGGQRGGRGWDGWMAPLTQRTRVWANSRK